MKFSPDCHQNEVTDEQIARHRRGFLKNAGLLATGGVLAGCDSRAQPASDKAAKGAKCAPYNVLCEDITAEKYATSYNNFYEFSLTKDGPSRLAGDFNPHPWAVRVEGLVESPGVFDLEKLIAGCPQEERIYRFRCVEAWSMVIPWNGFALHHLIKKLRPLSAARFVEFETLYDPKRMPNQNRQVIPWPYREGLRLDEAMNELAFMATGMYGKPLPNQNGAPIRLVVPWKYGFKSIKSIVAIRFTDKQPLNSWHQIAPQEYGFYANVNPEVDHPRWSQASERRIGAKASLFNPRIKTLPFNGYGEYVAHLYKGMDLRKFF